MGSKPFMTENVFKVNFHGVRGSIPSPLKPEEVEEKLLRAFQKAQSEDLRDENSIRDFVSSLPNEIKGTFGGNSSCVSMEVNGERLIFDAGSGIRMLGQSLMGSEFGRGQGKANLFFSHTHWDHILGIPFFVPFYIKITSSLSTVHCQISESVLKVSRNPNTFPFHLVFTLQILILRFWRTRQNVRSAI